MIIEPKIRGFICITSHPTGCKTNVEEQIRYVEQQGKLPLTTKKALIIGASTGYGLASRIVAAFGCQAATIGCFFEKPGEEGRPGTAGYYNSAAFEAIAHERGLYAKSFNGDAFSDKVKSDVCETIKRDLGKVDLVIYSLASPKRQDPKTGEVYSSTLKTLGVASTTKSLNTDKELVTDVTIQPADEQDVLNTEKVMGGEDWALWIDALLQHGLLENGATTVAYSYIGPEVTRPIYRDGTIGRAKEHLERSAAELDKKLSAVGGKAYVAVNKAVVTQASSAIPAVPLYISILYKVMKEKGNHEGCIEQMYRLFADHLTTGKPPAVDQEGRIRMDDWELRPDIQEEVAALWKSISTETLTTQSDFAGYKKEFLKLFGFGVEGVDYTADVSPVVS
jgi:enoyl-[acyl-carrier protein] reductase/trans-2-enoyl-CoA reductase (NAD+)